jgi:light-regulated signal transduction histidine kinase (bacteriophytochrome)
MAALARDALAEVQRRIPDRSIAWTVSELPACRGDRALLRQLWVALLENAAKFTGKAEAAAVSVAAENLDGEVEYCVRDNGAGLDSNYAGKLFKLFQRVHHDSEFEGLGVGLAVAHRIVARHGGSIRIEGAVGEGARVTFRLPA